jgi:uncharacterized protein (DUF58 family)
MLQRFLDPSVLAGISGLELVARTVVDGFVAGLHRSPDFGFSQEFAEYRAYSQGDDLRHIDWNVFARTERAYLKRYRGETNTLVTVLLDASASMGFSSHAVKKIDYARFLAASIFYLAIRRQRDGAGILIFDDEVRDFVRPSTRQGQLARLAHALERCEPRARTDFAKPFIRCQDLLRRRGIVVVVSDFYEQPDKVIRTMEPLRFKGSELLLFHVLDPQEIKPKLDRPVLLVDMETGDEMDVSPEYARTQYRGRIEAHIAALRERATASRMDYYLLDTSRPLDGALREYLGLRAGRI